MQIQYCITWNSLSSVISFGFPEWLTFGLSQQQGLWNLPQLTLGKPLWISCLRHRLSPTICLSGQELKPHLPLLQPWSWQILPSILCHTRVALSQYSLHCPMTFTLLHYVRPKTALYALFSSSVIAKGETTISFFYNMYSIPFNSVENRCLEVWIPHVIYLCLINALFCPCRILPSAATTTPEFPYISFELEDFYFSLGFSAIHILQIIIYSVEMLKLRSFFSLVCFSL